MKRILKNKFTYIFVALVAAAFIFFSSVIGGGIVSYAATSSVEYDQTYVLDDLKNSKVDGKQFNLKDYNFDSNKSTKVFSFVEYCYSFYANKQDNFGLYLYIYNPQGLDFVYNSVQNKVQFAIGDLTERYSKYSIQFLNASTETNYEGLFLKYKVVLSNSRKKVILDNLNSTERVYRVSGVELLQEGKPNATEYPASGYISDSKSVNTLNYTYTGYAAGYGRNNTSSTLNCVCAEGDALSLDVYSTYYRPEGTKGTSGKDCYTQDTLNSVYFAVPKEVVDKYGYLSEVHAEWLNAVTAPALVTANMNVYNAIYPYVGDDIGYNFYNIPYRIGGAKVRDSVTEMWEINQIAYNFGGSENTTVIDLITRLNWLFYAGAGSSVSSLDCVPAATIKQYMYETFSAITGESFKSYSGKEIDTSVLSLKEKTVYNALFESVDEEFTDAHIQATDKKSLTSQKFTQSWAQSWLNKWSPASVFTDDTIDAIYQVTDNDFATNTIEVICDLLKINKADYAAFKAFYDANKADSYIYLLRYAVTDYYAVQTVEADWDEVAFLGQTGTHIVDEDKSYIFKQHVFLDWDLIDCSFRLGEVKTVIPVVSSPMDVINDATKPVLWGEKGFDIWALFVIVLVCLIIALVVLFFMKVGSLISAAKTGKATTDIVKQMKRWKSNCTRRKRR